MQLISSRLGPKRRTPIRRAAEQIPRDDHGIVRRANLDPQREILRRVKRRPLSVAVARRVNVHRSAILPSNFLVEHEHQTIQITITVVSWAFRIQELVSTHRREREILVPDADEQHPVAFAGADRRHVKVFNCRGNHRLGFVLVQVSGSFELRQGLPDRRVRLEVKSWRVRQGW